MQFIDLQSQYHRIKDDVDRRIHAVLDHGQYVMGPEIDELEKRLADYAGIEHCVALSSGTDALLVAMMALDIGPGDEVITTPFTFIATGEMIMLLGATPVFADIDPRTYNLDPASAEAAITARTKAIVPVSLYGQCADMDAFNAVGERHGVPVIEDAAQSFGATYQGRRSCGLSRLSATSFFPAKPLGCYGDGGAAFTDDADLALRMRELRNHGQDRRYHHPRIGINGRLDTMQAAVLLAKLDIFDDEVAARGRLGARYTELLGDAVRTPYLAEGNTSVYAQYTVEVDDRDGVRASLEAAGVPTAVHYPVPLNRQPALRVDADVPVAEAAAGRVMSLPMHPYLSEDDQDRVVAALRAAVGA
ncbi:DegT/DnrJ/EryC1/StrS family aminotransferase [Salinisphaera sp. PC39]|uniref:DegT/DnrJ/EryC1/StrS family aminotransferase n=1 Tax=Salinisphaera sp. PC39 TaxID=1304156 RepID=UPI0033406A69